MAEINVPLCKPNTGKEELNAIKEVLESGALVHGKKCKELEKKFADYIGTTYAISTNSCTSALQLSIEAMELDGEIIVPSFTFAASANAIVLAGCTPVFADVAYETRNLDPESVRKKITNKTVGIMPVHYGGQSCIMDELMEIAADHNLRVIEDSAETIGGTFKGKKTGSFGDVGCFSLFPTKNMTTGEGGIVTTNNKKIYDFISLKIAHGMNKQGFRRDCITPGYNMRLTDIQGAMGLVQLKKLDKMNDSRRKIADFYNNKLQYVKGIKIPLEHDSCKHVYQMYTITVEENRRDQLIKKLNDNGIGASVHFDPPVHLQKYYKKEKLKSNVLKNTERLSKQIITLPMFPYMKNEQMEHVIKYLRWVNEIQ